MNPANTVGTEGSGPAKFPVISALRSARSRAAYKVWASLRRNYHDFFGTAVGLILLCGGVALIFSGKMFGGLSSELGWLLMGTGLGTAVTDVLAISERRRAESRHQEQLAQVLGTLSGTPRQALRFGTALAGMMTDPNWPSPDEKRFLQANARVLGASDVLSFLLADPIKRGSIEVVQDFLIHVRGSRGRHVGDGLLLGYRAERMAYDLIHNAANGVSQSADTIAEKQRVIEELVAIINESFDLDPYFFQWISSNLNFRSALPSNRVPMIRITLRMLWQSRHLQKNLAACECLLKPCNTRRQYLQIVERHPSAATHQLPADFARPLADFEIERRKFDFDKLSRF